MKKNSSSPHTTGYSPEGVPAGTVNVSEITLALSVAPTPAPFLFANAYSNVLGFVTISAPYASEPDTPSNLMIEASGLLMMNCAPPIGRFMFLESLTSTSTVTVLSSSPESTYTVWIAQIIAPSGAVTVVVVAAVVVAAVVVAAVVVAAVVVAAVVVAAVVVAAVVVAAVVVAAVVVAAVVVAAVVVAAVVVAAVVVALVVVVVSSSIMIAPSRSLIDSAAFLASSSFVMMCVISLPFVSETKIFPPQVTGYVPAVASAGIVYVSLITTLPSAASTGVPFTLPNANSFVAGLFTIAPV